MQTALTIPTIHSGRAKWAGRVLTAIPVLFLLFDVAGKLANIAPVREGSMRLGFEPTVAPTLGVILLACVALYLVPRTAVLGAVLLTGYFGGAVAIHLRVGDPLATHILFPIYMGIVCWLALYLRDARVRALGAALLGATPSRSDAR
jgi:hypothetical protein